MTEQDRIENWLQRRRWTRLSLLTVVSLLLLTGAAVALVLTWAVFYGLLWFILGNFAPDVLFLTPYLSVGFVLILFHGQLTTDRAYLSDYSFSTGTAYDKPSGGRMSNINPIAPDSAHSIVKMLVSVLYTGPRMCAALWRRLARMYHWLTLDRKGAAKVLLFLLEQEGRVPAKKIPDAVPQGHNPGAILHQLLDLDGVLYLKNEGPAFILSSSLRKELKRHVS